MSQPTAPASAFPAEDFTTAQTNKLGEYKGRFKAQSNYASSIGHPCLRALVYARTSADQAVPIDETGVASMQEGNDQEAATIRWIQDLGFGFIRSQERFELKEPLIHGKIDGVVLLRVSGHEAGRWPAEIKSIQPQDWERLSSQQDIAGSDQSWHRKWYAQVQLAIHHLKDTPGFGPYGVLLLKDKTRKRVKPIPFAYDSGEIATCIAKGIQINGHVAAGTLPERVSYTLGICKWCEYRLICNPEEVFQAGKNIDDPEFLATLREYQTSKAVASRADKLWEFIKETLRGVPYATCGEFLIEGKERKGGGWVINLTQVFTPSVEELASRAPAPAAAQAQPGSAPAQPAPVVNVFDELSALIEAAQTMENLQAVKGPAKEARDRGAVTPDQAQQLAKNYEAKAKTLKKGRA